MPREQDRMTAPDLDPTFAFAPPEEVVAGKTPATPEAPAMVPEAAAPVVGEVPATEELAGISLS